MVGTGVSVTDADFNPVTDTPFIVEFTVGLSDNFSTAEVTYTTKSKVGTGTYQLTAFAEAYGSFQLTDRVVSAYPPRPAHSFAATAASAYNVIEFEASDAEYTSATTGQNPISKFRYKLFLVDGTADTDYGNLQTVLGTTALVG